MRSDMRCERDTAQVVEAEGGKVLGAVYAPINTSDFSSFLLQAQASKAEIVGLANAGGDTTNSIKQGAEFGITQGGQKFAALLMFITDVHALGLKAAQGLQFTTAFYWDQNDETRAFSQRFIKEVGHMPTMVQAGVYSATMHYLKAVKALGSKEPLKVMEKMRETPINDFMTHNGQLRIDGRVLRDMYLRAGQEARGDRRDRGITSRSSRPCRATRPIVRWTPAAARSSRPPRRISPRRSSLRERLKGG